MSKEKKYLNEMSIQNKEKEYICVLLTFNGQNEIYSLFRLKNASIPDDR